MGETSQTVRIVVLSGLSRSMHVVVRNGQMESAKVWTDCRDALKRSITSRTKWPNREALQVLTKGKYGLHSQSAQMVCHAFLANVDSARQLRDSGRSQIRYPYKDKKFYPLYWPAQAMSVEENRIVLPMGRGRKSIVLNRPEWLTAPAPAKIIWNRSGYEMHVAIEQEIKAPVQQGAQATVDLGQIHQCAVTTNTGKGLIVSGRGIRSEKRRVNQMHGSFAKKMSRCKKGSKRWGKLNRARNRYALRSERRIRDQRHKGTRQAIDFCEANGVSALYVGNPDGVRKRRSGRKHNQRMSQWEYGKDISYLTYKSNNAGIASFSGTERGTSSHCPQCGHKHKPKGRNWVCRACDFIGHRDLVGSINMHQIAYGNTPTFPVAKAVTYLRPGTRCWKYLDRSSRPDTGHRKGSLPLPPALSNGRLESTTEVSFRASKDAGQIFASPLEAHLL
jgi:putative transposase